MLAVKAPHGEIWPGLNRVRLPHYRRCATNKARRLRAVGRGAWGVGGLVWGRLRRR